MLNMDSKIDAWKNKLLDMSKRNRLLNYRETKRSTLRFIKPDIFEMWDSFVLNEKPIVFPIAIENDERTMFSDSDEEQGKSTNSKSKNNKGKADSKIITDKSDADCQRTLRNLRNRSRSAMEEQGVNILYLSFGFLNWREANYSNEVYAAPLVLVPVTLKWGSILSPFTMELHEDEIILNPTLTYKLENDFGCKLPEFNLDTPIKEYFNQIEEIISNNQWSITYEVSLSLLSFLKSSMYYDLERHRDSIVKNPVIRAISGDASDIPHDITDIEDYDFDSNQKADQVFQVVDADSSQQEALLYAQKGISFVLQGPPGTGKSQTITNIIAQSLASGKKVLFVSEKMAALDVVYNRLKEADLADFCLVLHSYKANKKQTLDQLSQVFDLASTKATVSEEAYQAMEELTEQQEELDEYDRELHTVIEPLHHTIYDVNGILAEVQDYQDVIFSLPSVRDTSAEQYRKYVGALRQFANTIGMSKIDYHENPWRNANITFISNELRHDINVNGKALAAYANTLACQLEEICTSISFSVDDSYSGAQNLLGILETVANKRPFLSRWILMDDIPSLLNEVSRSSELRSQYFEKKEEIFVILQQVKDHDERFMFDKDVDLSSCELIDNFSAYIDDFISSDECYMSWKESSVFNQLTATCDEAEQTVEKYNLIHEQISDKYEPEVFEIPYNDIYLRFKSKCTSSFKIFDGQYRKDKKLIQNLCKDSSTKLTDEDILDVLTKLRELQDVDSWLDQNQSQMNSKFPGLYQGKNTDFETIHEHIEAFKLLQETKLHLHDLRTLVKESEDHTSEQEAYFGQMYSGIETDWDSINESLNWASGLKDYFGATAEDNKSFINRLESDDDFCSTCENYAKQLESIVSLMDKDFNWFSSLFDDSEQFDKMRLLALVDRCEECCNNLAALEEWIDFTHNKQLCYDLNLGEYIQIIESNNISKDDIISVFAKRFFSLWLDSVLPEFPAVANFRSRAQEERIDEFQKLDRAQFKIAQSRIRQKLISELPSLDHYTNGIDEISVLKHELSKQRRIMPIRQLFNRIPNLILRLKPCLMMSPLSVSRYLESDSFEFDTVIFDEASQVCTEDAIGSIIRGKQVIIAGDSKQLPPTSFFSSVVGDTDFDIDEDSEEDIDEEEDAFESILDEASLLPERTLLWHYRSRHEHLIAFSNAKIYNNKLITFPSSIEKAPGLGVEFIYVPNGFYDRGGRKGNYVEAEKVAHLVFAHFREYPNRSLGVIAFGEVQQLAIDTAIRKLRQEDQSYEQYFNEDKDEPFFIKSLENVQGDERDTIIFSLGYGKDANGVMHMNFGPLGKAGGERRLNVAITRAKYNVKLVSSILSTDIDLNRVTMEGPMLLRSYIEFAQKGPIAIESEITGDSEVQHESPFEEAVYNFLRKKGYKLETQVGCSGYRIDMAVKHPSLSGRYVLGIECDGAAYHSARTARERDRLRQDVLENMGWKIYRIWSTDWIKDTITEGKRLIEAVDTAIAEYVDDETPISYDPQNVEGEDKDNYLVEESLDTSEVDLDNPYHFNAVPEITWDELLQDNGGFQMEDCLERIITALYPVHIDDICQIIAPLLGREKATSYVKNIVSTFLRICGDQFNVRDQFYFPGSCKPEDISSIPVHVAGERSIKHISKEEIASGMLKVANACIGVTKDGLITETVRAFGFNRKGQNIVAAMEEAYDLLVKEKMIKIVDKKVSII